MTGSTKTKEMFKLQPVSAALAFCLVPLAAFAQTAPAPTESPASEAPAEAPAGAPADAPATAPTEAPAAEAPAVEPPAVETPMNSPETAATSAAACIAEFQSLDTDGNLALSEAEAPAALARARVDGMTIGENGLSQEDYNRLCENKDWYDYAPEEGAPFEGANSFTENQARDRILSWSFTDVSALTKDDQGIWRGTAKQEGKEVAIAVDYKGNVVATPQN